MAAAVCSNLDPMPNFVNDHCHDMALSIKMDRNNLLRVYRCWRLTNVIITELDLARENWFFWMTSHETENAFENGEFNFGKH